MFDWKRGTHEGVRLGDDSAERRRILGRPLEHGGNEPFEPVGEDFYEIGGLTNFGFPKVGTRTGSFTTLPSDTASHRNERPLAATRDDRGRVLAALVTVRATEPSSWW